MTSGQLGLTRRAARSEVLAANQSPDRTKRNRKQTSTTPLRSLLTELIDAAPRLYVVDAESFTVNGIGDV